MTAKEYLLRYRDAYEEAQDTLNRITALRLKYSAPSAIEYSDMPRARNTEHDMSDYVAKVEELTRDMIDKYNKCLGIEVDIYQRIWSMKEWDEREVLRLRYIDDLKWEEIAERISRNLRSVFRIHGRALQHFPVPSEKCH